MTQALQLRGRPSNCVEEREQLDVVLRCDLRGLGEVLLYDVEEGLALAQLLAGVEEDALRRRDLLAEGAHLG